MSVAAPPPLLVAEARDTTQRVARTFGLACRLLPRAVRTDVYLLYLVFRTLDDLVDEGEPDAAERVAAVDDWAHGRAGERTREVETLGDAERAPSAPPLGAGRLLRGDALGPRGPRSSGPRRSSTRTATASPGPWAS